MSGGPDPLYVVRARIALLDAEDALSEQLDAVVLVGAPAVYLHTGGGLLYRRVHDRRRFLLGPSNARHAATDRDYRQSAGLLSGSIASDLGCHTHRRD